MARENLKHYPKARFVQADLLQLPFPDRSFDVIYSFGVLHYTPDLEESFGWLLRLIEPGGLICITVYSNYRMYHTNRYTLIDFRFARQSLPDPRAKSE